MKPVWSDDEVPAELVPERYRLGEAFVPKGRYLDVEFLKLELATAVLAHLADGLPRGGTTGRRQLCRVPDRRPFDPHRPRVG